MTQSCSLPSPLFWAQDGRAQVQGYVSSPREEAPPLAPAVPTQRHEETVVWRVGHGLHLGLVMEQGFLAGPALRVPDADLAARHSAALARGRGEDLGEESAPSLPGPPSTMAHFVWLGTEEVKVGREEKSPRLPASCPSSVPFTHACTGFGSAGSYSCIMTKARTGVCTVCLLHSRTASAGPLSKAHQCPLQNRLCKNKQRHTRAQGCV